MLGEQGQKSPAAGGVERGLPPGRMLWHCLPDSRGSAPSNMGSPSPDIQEPAGFGARGWFPLKGICWGAKYLRMVGPQSRDCGLLATHLRPLETTRSLSILCKGLQVGSRSREARTPPAQPSCSECGPDARETPRTGKGRGAAFPHPPFHCRAEKEHQGGWGEVVAAPLTPSCAALVQVVRIGVARSGGWDLRSKRRLSACDLTLPK